MVLPAALVLGAGVAGAAVAATSASSPPTAPPPAVRTEAAADPALGETIRALGRNRVEGRRRLARADSPREIAAAASALSEDFAGAVESVRTRRPPGGSPSRAPLVRELSAAQITYERLASAARTRDGAEWDRVRRAVGWQEAAVDDAAAAATGAPPDQSAVAGASASGTRGETRRQSSPPPVPSSAAPSAERSGLMGLPYALLASGVLAVLLAALAVLVGRRAARPGRAAAAR